MGRLGPSALFTASDFGKLAEGVDPGVSGVVHLQVWDFHSNVWRLTQAEGLLTLHVVRGPADKNALHWETVGQVNLVKGKTIKIVTVDDTPKPADIPKEKAKPKQKQKSASKAAAEPKFVTVPPGAGFVAAVGPGSGRIERVVQS